MRLPTVLVALLFSAPLALAGASTVATPAPIVFVCEHGNVKSLMAASLFDRIAKERGLPFRAESRGVNPEPGVPPKIAEALEAEGLPTAGFVSRKLSREDVAAAGRVVAIGVDLSVVVAGSKTPVEAWTDIPAASLDYPAARAALLRHVEGLLVELSGNLKAMDPR